ncbi:MAG: hypothetical protein DRQ47_01965 [Gammaproteobacteria bacterium]|nr:MAG: hypothetical protein DRQ47_01965 [Gammaproteobacteria bacterium]
MNKLNILLLILAMFISKTVLAVEGSFDDWPTEEELKDESPWKGDVQFGYLMTSGNTETSNMSGEFNINYGTVNWRHLLSLRGFSSSDDDNTTAEHYKIDFQSDKKIDEDSYYFGNFLYEEDHFSGFDYRTSATFGYGHRLFNREKTSLGTEIGIGYRKSEVTPSDVILDGDSSEDEAIIRLAALYHWEIAKDRSLDADLTVDGGEELTITNFELSFVTLVVGNLSFNATYAARYTSRVPVDKENLDSVVSLKLLYAF